MPRSTDRYAVSFPLSFVPPLQSDELLSSWAKRIEAYYEAPGLILYVTGVQPLKLDVSPAEDALQSLAKLTGYVETVLHQHTLASDHPDWSASGYGGLFYTMPETCLQCLSEMSATSVGVYARRSWALSWSTMCERHLCPRETLCRCLQNTRPFLWRTGGGCELTCAQCRMLLRTSKDPIRPAIWRDLTQFESALVASTDEKAWRMVRDLVDLWGRCEPGGGQNVFRLAPMEYHPKWRSGEDICSIRFGALPPAMRRLFIATLHSMAVQLTEGSPSNTRYFNGLPEGEIVEFRQKVEVWPNIWRSVVHGTLDRLQNQWSAPQSAAPDRKIHFKQNTTEDRAGKPRRAVFLQQAREILKSSAGRQVLQLRGCEQQRALQRLARAQLDIRGQSEMTR